MITRSPTGSLRAPPQPRTSWRAGDRRSREASTAFASSSERDLRALGVADALDQHRNAVAAPEQFAVEHHGRHAEHAEAFRLVDDAIVLDACRPLGVGLEFGCRAAELGDDGADRGEVVELDLVIPETPEHRVVIGAKEAVRLREQHAGAGIEGIIDASRPLYGQALDVGETPRIHVEVAGLAPEM